MVRRSAHTAAVRPDAPKAVGAILDHAVGEAETLRLDRYLVFARFFRTRGRAQILVEAGRVRINGQAVRKCHALVRPGDVLTFPQGQVIRVIRILALPAHRGPATEAAMTYEEIAPAVTSAAATAGSMVMDAQEH